MLEHQDDDRLTYSFSAISFLSNDRQNRYKLSPDEREDARRSLSEMLKRRYKDKNKHPTYGTHISEERKKLIGDINRGNKYCAGRVLSEETKRKIGDANRNPSFEVRQKMSLARKGTRLRAENSNAKRVIRLSDGKVYDCMKDAAEDNCINYSTFKDLVHKQKGFAYQ